MPGDDRNDQFDDLFEPFELGDVPASMDPAAPSTDPDPPVEPSSVAPLTDATGERSSQQNATTAAAESGELIACPSCGARNPSFNHHCERCGSRLSQDPMPIAAAPAARSTAGGRALGVLSGVVLVVALVALMANIFRGDESDVASPETVASATTTTQPIIVTELFATSATASSQINDSFSAESLIDGDSSTRWNDNSLRGVGAWLEFTFATPVQITEIELQNVTDNEKFRRNFKIRGYTITVDDLNVPISGRLRNSSEPQRIKIASLNTILLRIEVTTTHPAESVDDDPPFSELALEGIRFFGVEK